MIKAKKVDPEAVQRFKTEIEPLLENQCKTLTRQIALSLFKQALSQEGPISIREKGKREKFRGVERGSGLRERSRSPAPSSVGSIRERSRSREAKESEELQSLDTLFREFLATRDYGKTGIRTTPNLRRIQYLENLGRSIQSAAKEIKETNQKALFQKITDKDIPSQMTNLLPPPYQKEWLLSKEPQAKEAILAKVFAAQRNQRAVSADDVKNKQLEFVIFRLPQEKREANFFTLWFLKRGSRGNFGKYCNRLLAPYSLQSMCPIYKKSWIESGRTGEQIDPQYWKIKLKEIKDDEVSGWIMFGFFPEPVQTETRPTKTLSNFLLAFENKRVNAQGRKVVELAIFCDDPAATFDAFPLLFEKTGVPKAATRTNRPVLQLWNAFIQLMKHEKVQVIVIEAIPTSVQFWVNRGFRLYDGKTVPSTKEPLVHQNFEAICRTITNVTENLFMYQTL